MKTNNKCAAVRLEKSRLLAALAVLAVAFVALAAIPAVDATDKIIDVKNIEDLKGDAAGDYRLINDITITSSLTISAKVTIDLNGFTLRGDNCDTIVVGTEGELVVKDNSAKKTGTVDVIGNDKAAVKNEGTTSLNGGIFERSKATYTYKGADEKYKLTADSYYTVQNLGTMTVNEVTIKGYVPADETIAKNIRDDTTKTWGAASCITNGYYDISKVTNPSICKMTIDGATIIGGLNTVKNDDYGELRIVDGKFSNYIQVSVQNHHVATIDGGKFDGAQSAVHNHPCNTQYDKGELTINGGSFKYASGYADVWDNGKMTGKITVGENVNISLRDENDKTEIILSKNSSVSFTDGSKIPSKITNGNSNATISNIVAKNGVKISAGSVIISGTMDATAASAQISSSSGDVVLKNLTITGGTLNLSNVTIGGKVTVKEGATVDAASNVEISSNGNLIVAGKVTGDGLTNNGTISIISPTASIPSAINGSGSIDASGAQAEGTLSGSYDTTTTFTKNQIITATGNITLVKGTTFTFKGTFIIPEGVIVTIEDGARLIAADATGKIINNGTIVVESRVADGGFYLSDTAIIENNGTIDLVYEGTSTQWSAFLKQGRFINNGTLTVGEGSNLILGESGKKLELENNGTVVVYGEINYRTTEVTILNSGLFQMNGMTYTDFTIYQMSTDASVEFDGFTNMYTTSNAVTITVSDAKYKSDDSKYDHTESTVEITAGYKDVVSGINISLVAEKKNENGKYLPQFLISGNVVVETEEENGTASAIIATDGDNIVSDSLTIGENVVLTIGGTLDVSGQISAVKNSGIGFADANAALTVTGKVSIVSATGLTGGKVNASAYVIPQTTASDKIYVYTTLVIAVADGADKIEILGDNEISENIIIPSGTAITVTGNVEITDDGSISFSEGASLKNNGVIDVDGVLYIADKKNSIKTAGDINSQVVIEGDKDKTYCNVVYALNNAAPGSTVKLSDDNTSIDIDGSMTIPAGVTLDTNGVNVDIAEKVVLTVDGTLQITSPSAIALEGADGDKAKIALNGTISSPDNAISDDLGITGAFYSITVKATTTYYAKPVTDAAAIISTVDDLTLTLKGGDLVIGDVSFTGTADAAASVVVMTKLTANSIALDLATISFSGEQAFTGTITNGTGTAIIAGKAANGFAVSSSTSKDVKTLAVSGQFTDSGKDDKFAVSGDVVFKAAIIGKLTVDGNAQIAKGSTETTVGDLVVNGVVEVKNEARLNVTGSVEVLGTLTAAAMTDSTAAGSITAVNAFVGISKEDSTRNYPVTTAASAVVSGKIAVSGYAIVADGSEVPESITSADTVKTTAYLVDGKAYVTIYAIGNTYIGIVKAGVSNALWTGWYSDSETMNDVSNQYVGSTGNETVNAIINYNIYDVVLKADAGIENVAIDGNLMNYNAIDGEYQIKGLKAGTHTVTYTLKNGYTGNATLSVNGEKQSGLSFTVSGNPATGAQIVSYELQLSGVTASGYTPVTPVTPSEDKDDGLTITDYLLIVLVVLIVIMAVIVAMRLMRS